ncbi:hypothetical protein K9M79_02230 [Candidatus Woesearchaeota archaeon]|nr:hypothetical protein [Candidatus Woesearchaeota archaeon]
MNLSTPIIKIVLSIITLYTAIVGGVYISYSLVWRRFEKDRIKQPHPIKRAILYIAAAILSAMNILLMTVFGFTSPLLLYLVMIPIIMSAIVYNVKHRKAKKMFDPFLSYVVLALGIYLLFFIESLVISYLQIIHYYIWGIITVFFKAVSHNVYRLTRGGFK